MLREVPRAAPAHAIDQEAAAEGLDRAIITKAIAPVKSRISACAARGLENAIFDRTQNGGLFSYPFVF